MARAVVGVLAIALLATACGGGPAAGNTSETGGGTAAETIARLPVQTMATFNPLYARGSDAVYINTLVFASLTRLDEEGEPQPWLATEWTPLPDGSGWTFKLRDDAKFQDGTPITAEDVKWTFDTARSKDSGSFHASDLTNLVDITTDGEHSVTFHMQEPDAWFPYLVPDIGILPKHAFEGVNPQEATDFNTQHPIGSGPYRVTEVVEGDHMTLEAWDGYWAEPKIKTFVFKVIPDVNTQVAELKSGGIDYAVISSGVMGALQGEPNLTTTIRKQATMLMLNFNHDNAILADRDVRQALLYGLNRQLIIDQVSDGTGLFATGPLTPDLANYYDKDIPRREYDPDRARQLLEGAGWVDSNGDGIREKDGKPLKLTLLVDEGNPTRQQVALIAQQEYREIGVQMDPVFLERSVWADQLIAGDFDAYLSDRSYSAFAGRLRRFWETGAGTNLGHYANPQLDELFRQGQAEFDPEKRQEIYMQVQEVFEADTPVIIVFWNPEIDAYRSDLVVPDTSLTLALPWAEAWYFKGS